MKNPAFRMMSAAPEMRQAIEQARALDAFCADADIQVVFHVMPRQGSGFDELAVDSAAEAVARLNPHVQIVKHDFRLDASNARELCAQYDVIGDGSDNFETRYLVNDYSVSHGVPWVYGAAVGSYGLAMPVLPGRTSCLKCIYPDPPGGAQPTCDRPVARRSPP